MINGLLAQLVEHTAVNRRVIGSSPILPANEESPRKKNRVWQLHAKISCD